MSWDLAVNATLSQVFVWAEGYEMKNIDDQSSRPGTLHSYGLI